MVNRIEQKRIEAMNLGSGGHQYKIIQLLLDKKEVPIFNVYDEFVDRFKAKLFIIKLINRGFASSRGWYPNQRLRASERPSGVLISDICLDLTDNKK